MSVTWVLESNVFAEVCFDEMVAHFQANSIPYHVVRVIPFVHEIDGPVPQIEGPCVVYGSIGVQKLARKHGWTPGVFTDEVGFSEAGAVAALGDLMVNADARRMLISEVADYAFERGHDREFFIKPNTDTKQFAGTVMEGYEFVPWLAKMHNTGYLDDNDFEVVVSEPKKLGCEWRVVVVDGRIVESSLYRQYGIVKPERHIIPEVEQIVMEAHNRFVPAPAYVIDIAQVRYGDEWDCRVIEYNTLNSAGLYACRPGPIIDAINEMLAP